MKRNNPNQEDIPIILAKNILDEGKATFEKKVLKKKARRDEQEGMNEYS